MTGLPWDASYANGPAPWDIGQPQPAVVHLAATGGFTGRVLDAGCGAGENALHIARQGLPVVGVDVAGTALSIARQKAARLESMIDIEFVAADALDLKPSGRTYQSVLDCGLFHTFNADERTRYVASLASVTEPSAILYVLCFSNEGPETGPHPIRQEELRAVFNPAAGWAVASIDRTRILTRFHGDNGSPAWLATMKRT